LSVANFGANRLVRTFSHRIRRWTLLLVGAVSFNQVLRTVGGSFGSALAGAVLAANLAPDLLPTEGGIKLALAVGAIGCAVLFAALLVSHVMSRPPTPTSEPAERHSSRL
jgi:hypothetical protein